jgi:hypothetical protein
MVTAQAECTISTAEILIRYRADLIGCTSGDVALAVVNRRLRFGESPTIRRCEAAEGG